VITIARTRQIAGLLQHGRQAGIGIGRRADQVVLQRQRQRGVDGLPPQFVLSELGQGFSLYSQRRSLQIHPAGLRRVGGRESGRFDRSAKVAGAVQVGGDGQSLGSGLAGQMALRKGFRSRLTGG
jgi:hypothetical protein